ncbi:hypothetical protein Q8A67_004125 [Cirrhinus molitorella]|uniref:Uncharacterized protein n=1 Tax=Cirrhinus molitorella TaxID=172907 RepID=A0AA88QB83_9TELE|nr:hypothetical protein Q8A67_004125 [Cirrhinus molitorella]
MSSDKATVIIQVNPQVAQDTVICDDGQQVRGAYHNTALQGFFKAQPKALGTVQIMIGVMVFILGIVLTANDARYLDFSVYSGITYWGSVIYISTGSLSVAAQNKLNPCVVKASLGMNVISAITAGISIVFTGIAMGTARFHRNCYYNSYDCTYEEDGETAISMSSVNQGVDMLYRGMETTPPGGLDDMECLRKSPNHLVA